MPGDWDHIIRYPIAALPTDERPTNVPVIIGVNWYPEFDNPIKCDDGRWRIAADGQLSTPRGGHCVCLLPAKVADLVSWWEFYDQGSEGACCGFGCARGMTLLNRKRYDARALYLTAQPIDEWDDTPPGQGTSVRATCEIMRTLGLRPMRGTRSLPVNPFEGISAYRWATTGDDWLKSLGRPNATEVPLLNSWGRDDYPHIVYAPVDVMERLRSEDGEFAIITDR